VSFAPISPGFFYLSRGSLFPPFLLPVFAADRAIGFLRGPSNVPLVCVARLTKLSPHCAWC